MAKLSSINKNERRKKLVEKNAAKYAKLRAIADDEALKGVARFHSDERGDRRNRTD